MNNDDEAWEKAYHRWKELGHDLRQQVSDLYDSSYKEIKERYGWHGSARPQNARNMNREFGVALNKAIDMVLFAPKLLDMQDGADEYDEVMRAQELIDGN